MAPVRSTLVATCSGEGSSEAAKRGGDEGGISMGPPSSCGVVFVRPLEEGSERSES